MDFGLLLRRASLVFAIVAIGAGLMVYFLHDWFHSDFLNSFDVAQPLGDAIGTVIIVVVAYLAQRLVSIAFYRDMMFGLARNQEVFASTNTNYQAVAEEVAEELAAVPAFNQVLQGQLHSVIQATEEAAYQITERLQAVDGVVTHLNEFVSTSSTESSQMVNESESRIADNQKLIVEMGLYIENRIQEAQADQERVAQVVAEARSLESLTKLIKGIASQTNLLALNAAIEAARAGEQGRGFAVVADEVRKLAERTTSSTTDIATMVSEIQSVTQSAVSSMQQAAQEVETGIGMLRESVSGLEGITGASQQVSGMAQQISEAAQQQNIASQEVASNMEHITDLIEQNTDSARQAKSAADELLHTAQQLDNVVAQFQLYQR